MIKYGLNTTHISCFHARDSAIKILYYSISGHEALSAMEMEKVLAGSADLFIMELLGLFMVAPSVAAKALRTSPTLSMGPE